MVTKERQSSPPENWEEEQRLHRFAGKKEPLRKEAGENQQEEEIKQERDQQEEVEQTEQGRANEKVIKGKENMEAINDEKISDEKISDEKINDEEEINRQEVNGEWSKEAVKKVLTEKEALFAQKEQELLEAKDALLRSRAEFDNYRKRMNKEKAEWFKYACMGLLEKLLPVLDNFDRAMISLDEQNEEIKNIFAGICMIEKQLKEILQNEGLEPIKAVGETFDPLLHEAVLQVPLEEGTEENQVVEELRKGYRFKDKVLRASMVKVAKAD